MKRKARFLCHLPRSRCSCIHPSVFLVSYIKFYSFGFPLRTQIFCWQLSYPGFSRLIPCRHFEKNLHIYKCPSSMDKFDHVICCVPTRRHVGSREDPGNEVVLYSVPNLRSGPLLASPICSLMSSLAKIGPDQKSLKNS